MALTIKASEATHVSLKLAYMPVMVLKAGARGSLTAQAEVRC